MRCAGWKSRPRVQSDSVERVPRPSHARISRESSQSVTRPDTKRTYDQSVHGAGTYADNDTHSLQRVTVIDRDMSGTRSTSTNHLLTLSVCGNLDCMQLRLRPVTLGQKSQSWRSMEDPNPNDQNLTIGRDWRGISVQTLSTILTRKSSIDRPRCDQRPDFAPRRSDSSVLLGHRTELAFLGPSRPLTQPTDKGVVLTKERPTGKAPRCQSSLHSTALLVHDCRRSSLQPHRRWARQPRCQRYRRNQRRETITQANAVTGSSRSNDVPLVPMCSLVRECNRDWTNTAVAATRRLNGSLKHATITRLQNLTTYPSLISIP